MAKEVYAYFLFFAALYFTISMFYRLKLCKHPKLNKSTGLSFFSMCFFSDTILKMFEDFFIIITPVWWFVFSYLWCYSCNHLGEPEIVPIKIKMIGYVQWPMTIYLFLHLYPSLLSVAHYMEIIKMNSLLMGSCVIFTAINLRTLEAEPRGPPWMWSSLGLHHWASSLCETQSETLLQK